MAMPRMIDDKRRRWAIYCLSFFALILVLIAGLFLLNWQWRSEGLGELKALQVKIERLSERMDLQRDLEDLNASRAEVAKYLDKYPERSFDVGIYEM